MATTYFGVNPTLLGSKTCCLPASMLNVLIGLYEHLHACLKWSGAVIAMFEKP
jgi:hypothetical protein